MTGHLYRYPNPLNSLLTIYVGQGHGRDRHHRSGKSSFGRRFKKRFPNHELPQPIRWTVEVSNQTELNEEETIAMFRYHTWRGYEDGMNMTFPNSNDYKEMSLLGCHLGGIIGGRKGGIKGGKVQGARNVANGHLARIRKIRTPEQHSKDSRIAGLKSVATGHIQALGREYGKKNAESGHMQRIQKIGCRLGGKVAVLKFTFDQNSRGGKTSIRKMLTIFKNKGRCTRWNIQRNKSCICGQHTLLP